MTTLGWTPGEFWAASVYEFETAILAKLREVEPEPWSDDQTMAFFDRMGGAS